MHRKMIDELVGDDEFMIALADNLMLSELLALEASPAYFLKLTIKETFIQIRDSRAISTRKHLDAIGQAYDKEWLGE